MNHLQSKSAAIMLLCGIAAVAAGCTSGKSEIRKPIAENLAGKWETEKSFSRHDGQWVEDSWTGESGQSVTIRPDGTAVIALTDPEGQTGLKAVGWSADDDRNELTLGKSTFSLLSLGAGELGMSFHQAVDSGTGETVDGEFKWQLVRVDESRKTIAEKLVGKWNFTRTYEKKDGHWVEISFGLPDEGWYSYGEDGSLVAYSRKGDDEMRQEMSWTVNNATGDIRWFVADQSTSSVVQFDGDDTHSVFYTNNFDPSTGQIVTGEYKDVFVREK